MFNRMKSSREATANPTSVKRYCVLLLFLSKERKEMLFFFSLYVVTFDALFGIPLYWIAQYCKMFR